MTDDRSDVARRMLFNPWTLLAITTFMVVDAARELVAGVVVRTPVPWGVLVYHNVAWWIPWYLIVPVVGVASTRWSVLGPRRRLAVAVHLGLAVGATVAHVACVAVLMSLLPIAPERWPGVLPTAARLLLTYGLLDLMTYVAAAAIWHAVSWSREISRRSEEARRLAVRTRELEHELTGATLEALRAQLNPHFLFNALNAIAGLVRGGDRQRAVSAIAQLGDLLRETLDGTQVQQVPLADEIALVRRYLDLEQIRLAGRLQLTVDVAEAEARLPVPSFLLQPLVENAIQHGIARWPEGGSLVIQARQGDGALAISVRDRPNRQGTPSSHAPIREGIGLGNTRRRLERLYGARASVRVVFPDEGGCLAEVVVPIV